MLNKVELIGNLGQEPEIRHIPSGEAVATLSVATSRRWKDKASGEKRDEVEWHRVILWGKLAEIAGEYLKKGAKIYIEGRIQTRKWTDDKGVDRYSTEIVGQQMLMLGDKGGNTARPPDGYDFNDDIPF